MFARSAHTVIRVIATVWLGNQRRCHCTEPCEGHLLCLPKIGFAELAATLTVGIPVPAMPFALTPNGEQVAEGASERGTRGNQGTAPIAVATQLSSNESSRGAQVLNERGMSSLDMRRVEFERGAGGDHDSPYTFALPLSMPQVLAWMRLLAKVHRGELQL